MSLYALDDVRVLGSARLGAPGSLTDNELIRRLAQYKRTVAARYKAVLPQELHDKLPNGALWVSPKIDGELWYVIVTADEIFLASPTGRVLTGQVPVLAELREHLQGTAQPGTILAGELWAARREGRPRVADVGKALSDADQLPRLAWTGFDVVRGGDSQAPEASREYAERLEVLGRLIPEPKRARVIKTEVVQAPGDVARLYGEWAEGGRAEGLVVRALDGRIFKVKPAFHLDVAIVGYTLRTEDESQIRNVLAAVMRQDGSFQIVGSVGNIGSEDERRRFKSELEEQHAPSRYRYASRTGALFQFVRPRKVIEILVTDIQAEDANGRPLPRMVLSYDEDGGWDAVRPLPGVSLYAPRLVRERDDKAVNPVDVRASQVLERVALDDLDASAQRVDLPASERITRRVWTKTTKGKLAVRKLVVFKTNKREVDPSWPAFVVHWTDYSAGRKDPLKREVRLAPSLEDAESIADDMISKGVKRGWSEVE